VGPVQAADPEPQTTVGEDLVFFCGPHMIIWIESGETEGQNAHQLCSTQIRKVGAHRKMGDEEEGAVEKWQGIVNMKEFRQAFIETEHLIWRKITETIPMPWVRAKEKTGGSPPARKRARERATKQPARPIS
jgi:hypothetical protein